MLEEQPPFALHVLHCLDPVSILDGFAELLGRWGHHALLRHELRLLAEHLLLLQYIGVEMLGDLVEVAFLLNDFHVAALGQRGALDFLPVQVVLEELFSYNGLSSDEIQVALAGVEIGGSLEGPCQLLASLFAGSVLGAVANHGGDCDLALLYGFRLVRSIFAVFAPSLHRCEVESGKRIAFVLANELLAYGFELRLPAVLVVSSAGEHFPCCIII